jgi:hypothetical protein
MLGIDRFLGSLNSQNKQECSDDMRCLNYLKIVNLGVPDIAIDDETRAFNLSCSLLESYGRTPCMGQSKRVITSCSFVKWLQTPSALHFIVF